VYKEKTIERGVILKKISVLFLSFLMVFGLAACNNLPDEVVDCLENPEAPECNPCEDGFELQGTECVEIDPDPVTCETGFHEEGGQCVPDTVDPVTCETGYHEEGGQCVPDTVTCETGYHEEGGQCVPDPLVCQDGYIEVLGQCVIDPNATTPEEVLATYIRDNWDGDMAYLGMAMASMDFSNAMRLTTEFSFEIEEDINETHYIDATIVDSFIFDEAGDSIQREIAVDVDGEFSFEFTVILQEVETGVHVYLQPELIISAITGDEPEKLAVVEWVGFTNEWALFEFDDSLQSVIQIEVLKDMVVALFFNEFGDDLFDVKQQELEDEIGFDLNQYGLDFDSLVGLVIDENWTQLELDIKAIDVEHIILNTDYLYIAPELYQMMLDHQVELDAYLVAGSNPIFTQTTIDLLNTTGIEPLVNDMLGTEAFFMALTEPELDALVEVVIKPMIESAIRQQLINELYQDWYETDLENFLNNNQQFFLDNHSWDITDQFAELTSLGAVAYYEQLTENEISIFWNAAWYCYPMYDEFNNPILDEWGNHVHDCTEWDEELLSSIEHSIQFEQELLDWLTAHQTVLMDELSYDVAPLISSINTVGALETVQNVLTDADIEILLEGYLYPSIEDLHAAITAEDPEVLEWFMDNFFGNPHIMAELANVTDVPFDNTILGPNMMAIDWDALAIELDTFDFEAYIYAIRDGQVAFDAYLLTIETPFPNAFLLLEPWSPAVLELEPYMLYVDDIEYAFNNLVLFEDYIDPMYWLDTAVDDDIFMTSEFYILNTFTIDGLGAAAVFNDLTDTVNEYMQGFQTVDFPFDEDWECDPLDLECEEPPLGDIVGLLSQFGDIEIHTLYDPSNLTWLEIGIDAQDFFDDVLDFSYQDFLDNNPGYTPNENDDIWTGCNVLELTITFDEEGSITIPSNSEVDNVNMIAEDFMKFGVTMYGYDYLKETLDYYMNNVSEFEALFDSYDPLVDGTMFKVYLKDLPFLDISAAFDDELSYILLPVDPLEFTNPLPLPGVAGMIDPPFPYAPEEIDYQIVLYWIDGTVVFDETVGFTEMAPYWLNDNLVDRNAYLSLVNMIEEDNWAMTKTFLMFWWDDIDRNSDEEPPMPD